MERPTKRKRVSEEPQPVGQKAAPAPSCLYCRRRHARCDKQSPCNNCVKNGIECTYAAPKKRGPRRGARQQLEKQLQELQKALEAQKLETELYKKQYQNNQQQNALVQRKNPAQTTIVSPQKTSTDLAAAALVFRYLNNFTQGDMVPGYSFELPKICFEDFFNRRATSENMFIYAILASGAMVVGERDRAQEFYNISNNFVQKMEHTPNYDVAGGLLMLSYYQLGVFCGKESTHRFLTKADSMCGYLKALAPGKYAPNRVTPILAKAYQVRGLVEMCPLESLDLVWQAKRAELLLMKSNIVKNMQLGSLPQKDKSLIVLILTSLVANEVAVGWRRGYFGSQETLNRVLDWHNDLTFLMKSETNRNLIVAYYSRSAQLYYALGHLDRALQYCGDCIQFVENQINTCEKQTPFMCISLSCMRIIASDLNAVDLLNRSCECLKVLNKTWPCANIILQRGAQGQLVASELRPSVLIAPNSSPDTVTSPSTDIEFVQTNDFGLNFVENEPSLSVHVSDMLSIPENSIPLRQMSETSCPYPNGCDTLMDSFIN